MIHKQPLQFIVACLFSSHGVPVQNPVSIGVNDKERPVRSIKNDAVRGFRPHAVYREKPFPETISFFL